MDNYGLTKLVKKIEDKQNEESSRLRGVETGDEIHVLDSFKSKKDNKAMYKFTKEQFNSCGWKLLEESGDLLASKYDLKNIESDFEKVFKLSKKKFYYLKYARP